MPASADDVRAAAEAVAEPALRRTLGELGLVASAAVAGDLADVTVLLVAPDHPHDAELVDAVRRAVLAVDGVAEVAVATELLSDEGRAALALDLHGDPAATAGTHDAHGHAEGRSIPLSTAGSRTRVLLVASGKGGVGKSSVSVNAAIALAHRGHDVAVVDADVWGFSIPRMLGIDRPPMLVDQMIVPPTAHGVRCISMGFFAREDQPVIWRGPMLHKALEQFLTDVWWDEPDYLVVDLPPGTGDISISMAQFLPRAEMVVVTTPQAAAQRVAQRAALMASRVNLSVTGVIENMSWFTADDGTRYDLFGTGGGEQLAADLGVPLIGQVPLVPALREGGDAGRPITVVDPTSPAAQAFDAIAAWLDEHAPRRVYSEALKIV